MITRVISILALSCLCATANAAPRTIIDGKAIGSPAMQRIRALAASLTSVKINLRPGDSTITAYRQARASNRRTIIKMDFGSLHVVPGEKSSFEINGGSYRGDVGNSVRRAHNLATVIGPVAVTRRGVVVGTATRHSSSEKPLLKALSGGLR